MTSNTTAGNIASQQRPSQQWPSQQPQGQDDFQDRRYPRSSDWDRRSTEQEPMPPYGTGEGIATALGWLSVGLGIAQLTVPHLVAEMVGIANHDRNRTIMRVVGLREIVTGTGLLMQPQNSRWLAARTGGDVIDLALLGAALTSHRAEQGRIGAAMLAVLGIAAVDAWGSQHLRNVQRAQDHAYFDTYENGPMHYNERRMPPHVNDSIHSDSIHSGSMYTDSMPSRRQPDLHTHGLHVRKSITIRRDREQLYKFWRNLENLPQLMGHLEKVEVIDDRKSHWTAKAPAGLNVSWDAELVEDKPNEQISWRSLPGATVENSGSVRFIDAPRDRGTEIHVELQYSPPGGKLGSLLAKLFGEEPEQQIKDDLRRLKQTMETGEIMRSEATVQTGLLDGGPAQAPEKPVQETS